MVDGDWVVDGGGKSRLLGLHPLPLRMPRHTSRARKQPSMSDYATVKVGHRLSPLFYCSSLHPGAPPVSAPVLCHRSRGTLALYRQYTPSLHLCACLLFFDVCPLQFRLQASQITTSPSLPKTTIPVRETVVAITASALAGFGIVALFCSAGVYV